MSAMSDDRLLSAWLHDTAPSREPEQLLGQVLARTARTRRRPAWRNPERFNLMSAISKRFAPVAPVPWRLVAVATAVLLALAVGLALLASGKFRTPAPPYGLAANGQIFYSQGGDLYARSPGGNASLVLSGATTDSAPVITPDGTKLSFLRAITGGYELWVMNADGSNVHKLDAPGPDIGWFEWAPQGDVAVVLIDSRRSVLMTLPADGSAPFTRDLGVDIDQPVFRPASGSQLAFLGTAGAGERGIYLVNRDGTGLVRLDLDPGYASDPGYESQKWAYFWTESWSPTGEQLLYTQLEPDATSSAGAGFRMHLASVGASGQVTSDQTLEFSRSADDELGGLFLPGADGMVFESKEGNRQSLWFAPIGPSGVGPARSLDIAANDWISFQPSPDGAKLIAVMPAPAGVTPTVYLVDVASGDKAVIDLGADAAWQRLSR